MFYVGQSRLQKASFRKSCIGQVYQSSPSNQGGQLDQYDLLLNRKGLLLDQIDLLLGEDDLFRKQESHD